MRKLEHSEIKNLVIQANVGSAIGDCIKEGSILALENNVDVLLFYNDNQYNIRYADIISSIYTK